MLASFLQYTCCKMNVMQRDGYLKSIWQDELQDVALDNAWDKSLTYDVLIVGAGITGLTTALMLQSKGKKCIVAEAHNIGFGTSGGTTAHLNTMLDTTYPEIESDFGEDSARLVALAAQEGIQIIDHLSHQYSIRCDLQYKKGYLLANDEKQAKELEKIIEASQRAGIRIGWTNEKPLPLSYEKACVFDGQAQFNIGQYLTGLARAFVNAGGVLLQNCLVGKVSSEGRYIASATLGDIEAHKIVYATHIPPGINLLHFRCAPYRSYVMAFTLKDNNYPADLVYDMDEPYHYFRTQNIQGKNYLIAGGFDHKTGHNENTDHSFRELEAYLHQHFAIYTIDYKWSSQYYTSADGLPYIGKLPGYDDIYTATGFIGNGMVWGSLSGKIISDIILERESPYEKLFAPGRIKPIAGFTEFVKENADVVSQFIGMRFAYEQIDSLASLAPGEAMLADWENKKVALYKDENGKVHALDPVCPHAKCIVAWNSAEKSWDCPCHGGRYAPNGALLTGPARKGLEQIIIDWPGGD